MNNSNDTNGSGPILEEYLDAPNYNIFDDNDILDTNDEFDSRDVINDDYITLDDIHTLDEWDNYAKENNVNEYNIYEDNIYDDYYQDNMLKNDMRGIINRNRNNNLRKKMRNIINRNNSNNYNIDSDNNHNNHNINRNNSNNYNIDSDKITSRRRSIRVNDTRNKYSHGYKRRNKYLHRYNFECGSTLRNMGDNAGPSCNNVYSIGTYEISVPLGSKHPGWCIRYYINGKDSFGINNIDVNNLSCLIISDNYGSDLVIFNRDQYILDSIRHCTNNYDYCFYFELYDDIIEYNGELHNVCKYKDSNCVIEPFTNPKFIIKKKDNNIA